MRKLVKKPTGLEDVALEKFCRALSRGDTQSDALRLAFPHTKTWSPGAVWSRASRLAARDKVATRVKHLKEEYYQKLGISPQRVLKERARLAFFDPGKLFDENGSPLPINSLDDDSRAAIQALEVADMFEGVGENRQHVGVMHKIKIADKSKSLEALEKHLGLYSDKPTEQAFFNITIHI